MPKKSSPKKQTRIFRSKEEIQRILSEVAAAQANGATLTAALKAIKIPYNNYNNWLKKAGKPAGTPKAAAKKEKAPKAKKAVAKKVQAKAVAIGAKKGKRVVYTAQQKEAMRQKDQALKAEGKKDREIAAALGISAVSLYKMRKAGKASAAKSQGRPTATQQIKLSPDNPMYQLALAHERLMSINKQIETLMKERDKLSAEMGAMMKKAAEVCPGLKGKK
jgi:hypothetical protein